MYTYKTLRRNRLKLRSSFWNQQFGPALYNSRVHTQPDLGWNTWSHSYLILIFRVSQATSVPENKVTVRWANTVLRVHRLCSLATFPPTVHRQMLFLITFSYVCVCRHVWVSSNGSQKRQLIPGAGVTNSWELPDMDPENYWPWFLCKSHDWLHHLTEPKQSCPSLNHFYQAFGHRAIKECAIVPLSQSHTFG